MATLTSTGAVNLTSAANWSPAQIPANGDALIIGAHAFTIDADLVLLSVTFNNPPAITITGATRVVEATNGWTSGARTGNLFANITNQNVTLRGRWNINGFFSGGRLFNNLVNSNLTLATIGENPANVDRKSVV